MEINKKTLRKYFLLQQAAKYLKDKEMELRKLLVDELVSRHATEKGIAKPVKGKFSTVIEGIPIKFELGTSSSVDEEQLLENWDELTLEERAVFKTKTTHSIVAAELKKYAKNDGKVIAEDGEEYIGRVYNFISEKPAAPGIAFDILYNELEYAQQLEEEFATGFEEKKV